MLSQSKLVTTVLNGSSGRMGLPIAIADVSPPPVPDKGLNEQVLINKHWEHHRFVS